MTRNLNVRAAEVRARVEGRGKGGRRRNLGGHLLVFPNSEHKHRSRNASAAGRGRGGGSRGALSNRAAKQQARLAKLARNYEVRLSNTYTQLFYDLFGKDEEWRTVYVGFVERGTTEQELAEHFKVDSSSYLSRLEKPHDLKEALSFCKTRKI